MTKELKELGLALGQRRVGLLMKERAIIRHWSEELPVVAPLVRTATGDGERHKGQAEQEVLE